MGARLSHKGWDYWGVDQTAGWVQIPETNDGEGTGFVNIADHFIKPDTLDKIQIVFSGPGDHSNGDGGALRSLRHVLSGGESRCGFCMNETEEGTEGTQQSGCRKEHIPKMKANVSNNLPSNIERSQYVQCTSMYNVQLCMLTCNMYHVSIYCTHL